MQKLYVFILMTGLVLSNAIIAKNIEFKPNHPERYTVIKGDTLWGISAKFLKDPWVWPSVWHANPQVKNPHLIYPGDTISLVYIDGKPQLRIDRGRPVVKLTPKGRIVPLNRAVPTIPLNAIKPFLSKPFIVSKDELKRAPYVVRPVGEHLITGAGDRVYVRGHTKQTRQHSYVIVREGQVYIDPITKEILGYEAKFIGDSKLISYGDPATHFLISTTREVLIGDRVMPATDVGYHDNFTPKSPDPKMKGHIIAVMDGLTQIGQHQVIVINKGKRNGIQVGHVMAVFQQGKVVNDTIVKDKKGVQLPSERAGVIMVFRTFDKMSYALVMQAKRNMNVLDVVRKP